MFEVWGALLLIFSLCILGIYLWVRTFIIDILKSVDTYRKSPFSKTQWSYIWIVSIIVVLILVYLSWKFDILLL